MFLYFLGVLRVLHVNIVFIFSSIVFIFVHQVKLKNRNYELAAKIRGFQYFILFQLKFQLFQATHFFLINLEMF